MEFYIVFEHPSKKRPIDGEAFEDMAIFSVEQEEDMLKCLMNWAECRMEDYDETAESVERNYSVFRGEFGTPKETWKQVAIQLKAEVTCTLA